MNVLNKKRVLEITKIAVTAAIYVVLTVAISPLSYGIVQFRFSEMLMLLCCYDKKYCPALTLGCFMANIFSTVGAVDMLFGTLATLLAALCMCKVRNVWLASLFPTLFNGLIVGMELNLIYKEPFLISAGSVALGEFVVVTVIGVPIYLLMMKNKKIAGIMKISGEIS